MKILIFGKGGYLATRMAETWPNALLSEARIETKEDALKEIDLHKPDVVVNAAGRTGRPNVDWCETHKLETVRGNTLLALEIAEACAERNIYLLHIGSGCIFYGPSPDPRGWTETDHAAPLAFYSRTKYAADLVLSQYPNVGIARLRMPIDNVPNPRNLIDKLANYKSIIDVENSVSVVEDLLSACYGLLEKRGQGVFHTVNPGTMKHRDLIKLYQEYVDPTHACEWISQEELLRRGLATATRSNCILQSDRLTALGIHLRPIDVALRDTIQKYATQKKRMSSTTTHPSTPTPSFHFLKQKPREMKGVIAAGGRGTRLAPLTNVTNKHLLPVANKQMVMYPLQTLLDSGIRQIMLITGPDHAGQFMSLLGSGAAYGCRITYRIQDESAGIAHAVGMAEDFIDNDNTTIILGDNLFDENFLPHVSSFQSGAMVFYKPVEDPKRFGVIELSADGRVLSIEEKPSQPKSNLAQVGLYIYEPSVFDIIKHLKPSNRGELEITDVNKVYLEQHKLVARPVRGFWSDAGTFPSLKRSTEYFSSKLGGTL